MVSVVVENVSENEILIENLADINHIKNVFRKKIGDEIRAVDGEYEYFCEITNIEDTCIYLKILKKIRDDYSCSFSIEAGISLLKNDKMDLTIQKLTEIGISKIIPILAKRSVSKLTQKKDKWDTIVREALKQCQGVSPTEITDIVKIQEIDFSQYSVTIVPYESAENTYIKDIIRNLEEKPQKVLYIIGPEGGFDREEIEYMKSKGAKIVTLGNRILRAETAAIVTGGVLINELQ